MTEVVCRSPQQIRDDALIGHHDDVTRLLNTQVAGRCLYVGEQRAALVRIQGRIEESILNGDSAKDWGAAIVGALSR